MKNIRDEIQSYADHCKKTPVLRKSLKDALQNMGYEEMRVIASDHSGTLVLRNKIPCLTGEQCTQNMTLDIDEEVISVLEKGLPYSECLNELIQIYLPRRAQYWKEVEEQVREKRKLKAQGTEIGEGN